MADSDGTAKLIFSFVAFAVAFGYLWRKKHRQLGETMAHVRVYVNDAQLRCHVCAGEHFRKREGLVNTQWLTLFRLDWLNESAHCISCVRCGYTHWFMSRKGASDPEYPVTWIRYETSTSRPPL